MVISLQILWLSLYSPQYILSFLASIIEQTKVEQEVISLTLYAKLSKELMPTTGIFFTSAKALIVAIPILTPVKDPGPIAAG